MRQEHECCIVLEVEAVSNYIPIIRICMFQFRERQTVTRLCGFLPGLIINPAKTPCRNGPNRVGNLRLIQAPRDTMGFVQFPRGKGKTRDTFRGRWQGDRKTITMDSVYNVVKQRFSLLPTHFPF